MKKRTHKRTNKKRIHKRTNKKRTHKRIHKRIGGGKGTKSKGNSKGKSKGNSKGKAKASNSAASQLTSSEKLLRRGNEKNPEKQVFTMPEMRKEIFKFLMENKPDSYSPVYEVENENRKLVTFESDIRRPIHESISKTIKGANLKYNQIKRFEKHGIETTYQLLGIVFMIMGPDKIKEEIKEDLNDWLHNKIIIDNPEQREYIIDYLIGRIELEGIIIPE
tara:strand:+ start:1086 stop:1745 length:660 start_codon:yes stop_codon:yes gene_type:complete